VTTSKEHRKRKAEKGISKKERGKNYQYMKSYRARKILKKVFFISKFHDIVSQWPMYICTCCDQMFYKQSAL